MQLERNEVLTGLLVIGTIGVIAFLLVLLGAPGLFRPLVTYRVYFDNAAGIKPGAVVMLAGRKIGQVQRLYSPVTSAEEKQAQQAAAKMLEVIKPVAAEATDTMKDLQQTADNLNHLTDQNSELNLALAQFKTFGEHLSDLSAPDSALSHSLTNIEKISTSLTDNDNIEVTLRNLRNSSDKLKLAVTDLGPAGENIKQFSETIKTQPWRLIWPTTKKYPEASPTPAIAREGSITVRKTAKAKPRPRATP